MLFCCAFWTLTFFGLQKWVQNLWMECRWSCSNEWLLDTSHFYILSEVTALLLGQTNELLYSKSLQKWCNPPSQPKSVLLWLNLTFRRFCGRQLILHLYSHQFTKSLKNKWQKLVAHCVLMAMSVFIWLFLKQQVECPRVWVRQLINYTSPKIPLQTHHRNKSTDLSL